LDFARDSVEKTRAIIINVKLSRFGAKDALCRRGKGKNSMIEQLIKATGISFNGHFILRSR